MSDITREDLERQAQEAVCACWVYDLANDLETVTDEDLRKVIDEPQYFHHQNQIENPVSIDEYIEEVTQCPSWNGETIKHEPGNSEAWHCICGNEPHNGGFYPCNIDGQEVEPTEKDWNGRLYVCADCGRIIDQDTLKVLRRVDVPCALDEDADADVCDKSHKSPREL